MIAETRPSGYIALSLAKLGENFQDTGVILIIQEVESFHPKGDWMLSSASLLVWPVTSDL